MPKLLLLEQESSAVVRPCVLAMQTQEFFPPEPAAVAVENRVPHAGRYGSRNVQAPYRPPWPSMSNRWAALSQNLVVSRGSGRGGCCQRGRHAPQYGRPTPL